MKTISSDDLLSIAEEKLAEREELFRKAKEAEDRQHKEDQIAYLSSIAKFVNAACGIPEDAIKGEDGLFYCNVCKEPLQCYIELDDGEVTDIIRRKQCACERAKAEVEKAEEKERIKQQTVDHKAMLREEHRKLWIPDEQFRDMTFKKDDMAQPDLTRIFCNYVKNFDMMLQEGHGLILYGDVGTGKSSFAAMIANALINRGYKVKMGSMSRYVSDITSEFSGQQARLDDLKTFDLVIIDDFGAERDSEYMREKSFDIINALYNNKVSVIVTTNLGTFKTNDIDKSRMYDRLRERCTQIKVGGKNRRNKNAELDALLKGE